MVSAHQSTCSHIYLLQDPDFTEWMACRYLRAEDCFDTIDVFEQQASFGGVWSYSNDPSGGIDVPQTNPYQPLDEPVWHLVSDGHGIPNGAREATFVSPMYKHLETNIPHSIMKFEDMPSLEDHQLFPSREVVMRYLEDYGEDVRHLVSFQTQVTSIHQNQPGAHQIRLKDLQTNTVFEKTYDAVVVANGHYSVPRLPEIHGIKEWNQVNPGIISHTKYYRRPGPFADKKVIIVGNAASGTDIASQIGAVSKHPLLMSQRSESILAIDVDYKEDLPEIEEFLPDSHGTRAVRFANGRIEEDIDAVIFATGYYYAFPFFPLLESKLISTGERVQHLYKHIFYINDPTIAFIGVPSKIIPFRTAEGQAAVVARVWAGRLELPPTMDMRKWEEDAVAERGDGRAFHILSFPEDFEYYDELVDWATGAAGSEGKIPTRWSARDRWARERFLAIKKAFADKGHARHGIKTLKQLGFDYDACVKEQNSQSGAGSG